MPKQNEVKKFGQVTVELDYKHTSYMTKCNFVLQELSFLISIVTLKALLYGKTKLFKF